MKHQPIPHIERLAFAGMVTGRPSLISRFITFLRRLFERKK